MLSSDSRTPLIASLVILMLLPLPAAAAEWGIRAGTSTGGGTSYNSQEIYLRTALPWGVGDPREWRLSTQAEVNAGRISASGDALVYGGGSLNLWLRNPELPVSFTVGSGPTYLSETTIADRDFGGNWQLTSHAGAYLHLQNTLAIGYRIQHTSNAGLYSEDDGYTVHSFEFRAGF